MKNVLDAIAGKVHLNSIKTKIFIFFIIISIVPLLILTAMNYAGSVSVLKDEINNSNSTLLEKTIENLDNTFKMIEDRMWSFVILDRRNDNRYVVNLGKYIVSDPYHTTNYTDAAMEILLSYADSSKYIDSVYLYSFGENYLVTSRKNSELPCH